MAKKAVLALADGSIFCGRSFGADGFTTGEVVFNTAMTGYQEILTDPSYASQLVTLTYPHIGNTGTNFEDNESDSVQAAGLIVRDLPILPSNYRMDETLSEFLTRQGIVAISDIDTRRLTRVIRSKGAQGGCIAVEPASHDEVIARAKDFGGLLGLDLAREVTCASNYAWENPVWRHEQDGGTPYSDSRFHVVAYDFGVKRNILRLLVSHGCRVTVVPATTPAADALALQPDGIFLSNGPGDPEPCDYAIAAIREFLERRIPVFGICLGHQLLALAAGAKTTKMKFGHHGANHPVQDLATGKVAITSQNHGFAVDEDSLPDVLRATHRSLFDGTLQGIEHTSAPAFGFQGHPEASPGPHDIVPLFERFTRLMSVQQEEAASAQA